MHNGYIVSEEQIFLILWWFKFQAHADFQFNGDEKGFLQVGDLSLQAATWQVNSNSA